MWPIRAAGLVGACETRPPSKVRGRAEGSWFLLPRTWCLPFTQAAPFPTCVCLSSEDVLHDLFTSLQELLTTASFCPRILMLVTGCPVSFPSPTLESRKAQSFRQMASYDSDLQSLGLLF